MLHSLIASAVLAIALLALPASAGALPYLPPKGKVLRGGQGGYTRADIQDFRRQSGPHPAVFNYFISWRSSDSNFHWLSFRLADARAENTAPMLSVAPEDTGLRPRDRARGGGDTFLIRLNGLLADHGEVTYLRPLSEMNISTHPRSRAAVRRAVRWARLTSAAR